METRQVYNLFQDLWNKFLFSQEFYKVTIFLFRIAGKANITSINNQNSIHYTNKLDYHYYYYYFFFLIVATFSRVDLNFIVVHVFILIYDIEMIR